MKFIIASLLIFSASAFAYETEYCWGGPYWSLMDKSEAICNQQQEAFSVQNQLKCKMKYHNDPNVCWSDCSDSNGKLRARLRVDMYSNCEMGTIYFKKNKITWYR